MNSNNDNFHIFLLISFISHIILGYILMFSSSSKKALSTHNDKIVNLEFATVKKIANKTAVSSKSQVNNQQNNIVTKKDVTHNLKDNKVTKNATQPKQITPTGHNQQKTSKKLSSQPLKKVEKAITSKKKDLETSKNLEKNNNNLKDNNQESLTKPMQNNKLLSKDKSKNASIIKKDVNLKLSKSKNNIKNKKTINSNTTNIKDQFSTEDPFSNIDTISYADVIKTQIQMYWNHTIGAVSGISVVLTLNLTLDGTVESIKEISNSCPANQRICNAFIQSTKRSIWAASPFQNLPVEEYNEWKTLTFEFVPED